MVNLEEVLMELTKFEKLANPPISSSEPSVTTPPPTSDGAPSIPPLLEEYLLSVAKTGNTHFPWQKIKPLFRTKMDVVIREFHATSPTEDLPHVPNVDAFSFTHTRDKVFEQLELFPGIPFTVQRICELITAPQKHYRRTDKYLRALLKNTLIVSTVAPKIEPPERPEEGASGSSANNSLIFLNGEPGVNESNGVTTENEVESTQLSKDREDNVSLAMAVDEEDVPETTEPTNAANGSASEEKKGSSEESSTKSDDLSTPEIKAKSDDISDQLVPDSNPSEDVKPQEETNPKPEEKDEVKDESVSAATEPTTESKPESANSDPLPEAEGVKAEVKVEEDLKLETSEASSVTRPNEDAQSDEAPAAKRPKIEEEPKDETLSAAKEDEEVKSEVDKNAEKVEGVSDSVVEATDKVSEMAVKESTEKESKKE